MKYLIVILVYLLLTACAKNDALELASTAPGLPSTGTCKSLQSLWTSASDSEVHDLRGLAFSFVFVPYSYIGTNGAICTQQMKWFMFTPEINGSSFEFDLQNSPGAGCANGTFYIRYYCSQIQICNSSFSSCKAFN